MIRTMAQNMNLEPKQSRHKTWTSTHHENTNHQPMKHTMHYRVKQHNPFAISFWSSTSKLHFLDSRSPACASTPSHDYHQFNGIWLVVCGLISPFVNLVVNVHCCPTIYIKSTNKCSISILYEYHLRWCSSWDHKYHSPNSLSYLRVIHPQTWL
jgi:hypothetical protein